MKTITLIAAIITISITAFTQKLTPPTEKYTTASAYTNSAVNSNTGTPMVTNPVENNNPSVQASIPINDKPSGLEVDNPQNNIPQPTQRIINNNAQANTTVKTSSINGVENTTAVVVKTNTSNDTLRASTEALSSTPVAASTVVYNSATGVDAARKTNAATVRLSNGNTVPVLQTYVSQTVVTKFKNIYGDDLYDIRLLKSADNRFVYVVRITDNGLYKTIYLTEDGTVVQ